MLSRSIWNSENIKPGQRVTGDVASSLQSRLPLRRTWLTTLAVCTFIACLITAVELASHYRKLAATAHSQQRTALSAYSNQLAASIYHFNRALSQQLIDDMVRLPDLHQVILQRNNQESLVAGSLQGVPLQHQTQRLSVLMPAGTRDVGSVTLFTDTQPIRNRSAAVIATTLLTNLARVLMLATLGMLAFHHHIGRHVTALATETRRAQRAEAADSDCTRTTATGSIAGVLVAATETLRAQHENGPGSPRALALENAALRDQLDTQKPMAALGARFGTVVHEVRNPIAVICASTRLLTLQLRDTQPGLRAVLQRLDENALRCSRLLDMSRDLAQGDNNGSEPVELNGWLAHHFTQFEPPSGVSLHFRCAENAVFAHIDPFKVEQILLNLIENAAHAALSGATSHSVVDPDTTRIDVAVSQSDSGFAHITVRDRGPGVAPAHTDHLFDPLYTTKPDGMGMGLSICSEIATLLGGTLTLEPATTGTVARLTLPSVSKSDISRT